MGARMIGGYWIMKVPMGYRMEKILGHGKMLVKDEQVASIIKKGLEAYASGRFTSAAEL